MAPAAGDRSFVKEAAIESICRIRLLRGWHGGIRTVLPSGAAAQEGTDRLGVELAPRVVAMVAREFHSGG